MTPSILEWQFHDMLHVYRKANRLPFGKRFVAELDRVKRKVEYMVDYLATAKDSDSCWEALAAIVADLPDNALDSDLKQLLGEEMYYACGLPSTDWYINHVTPRGLFANLQLKMAA